MSPMPPGNNMKTFVIYRHPTQGYEAVKVGFSWPAFFFGLIWMLVKKLWSYAGIWFLVYIALSVIETLADQASSAPGLQAIGYFGLAGGYFALWLIPAFRGNTWRVSNLQNNGYVLLKEIPAPTPKAAIAGVAKEITA